MTELIIWCNENTGFLSALLSIFTILLSVVAIVVSIQTARLPYKKRLLISSSTNLLISQDLQLNVSANLIGISVSATNIGNRNVNLTFIGLAIKKPFQKINKLTNIRRDMGGTGVLSPTEESSVQYFVDELASLATLDPSCSLYCIAFDTEGAIYRKKIGKAVKIYQNMCKMK